MQTHVFTLKTTREDYSVGWRGEDRDAALRSLSASLVADPATTIWRYANVRGGSGVEQKAIGRIVVFRDHLVSVEGPQSDNPVVDMPEPA